MDGRMDHGLDPALVLGQCALFAGLPRVLLEQLAGTARLQKLPAQREIFTEGERCDGLWVVDSGRLRLFHTSVEGRQQVVGFRSAGAALELGPALDGRPFTVSAASHEGATLVFLPRPALLDSSRHPAMARNVIDQLCTELRQLDIATAVATLKDARRRVYCAVLRLAQQFGTRTASGSIRIDYRLTRRDVADVSGVTLETAIRVLSDLQHRNILRTRSQFIEILDLAGLEHPSACADCQLSCGGVDNSTSIRGEIVRVLPTDSRATGGNVRFGAIPADRAGLRIPLVHAAGRAPSASS